MKVKLDQADISELKRFEIVSIRGEEGELVGFLVSKEKMDAIHKVENEVTRLRYALARATENKDELERARNSPVSHTMAEVLQLVEDA